MESLENLKLRRKERKNIRGDLRVRNIHQVEQGGRYMVGRAFWLPRGLSS